MINRILESLKEGVVYRMTYFGVVPNLETYRANKYEFKLGFLLRTKIVACECEIILRYGLSLVSCDEVSHAKGELDNLVGM